MKSENENIAVFFIPFSQYNCTEKLKKTNNQNTN
jgi:hypothetical protein